ETGQVLHHPVALHRRHRPPVLAGRFARAAKERAPPAPQRRRLAQTAWRRPPRGLTRRATPVSANITSTDELKARRPPARFLRFARPVAPLASPLAVSRRRFHAVDGRAPPRYRPPLR